MSSVNERLTILLLIKDRPQFTLRWMKYVNDHHFPFKIFVADGGLDKKIPKVLSEKENFPNICYQYVQYPYDQDRQIFTAKIVDALSKISSTFTAIANDDDIFSVIGLKKAVDFLSKNPDYKSAAGRTIGFYITPDTNPIYGDNVEFVDTGSCSFDGKLSLERVLKQFQNYKATYYDVHYTKDLHRYFSELYDMNIKTGSLAELVTSFLTVADGKVHRNSEPYLYRQFNTYMSQNSLEKKKYGDQFDRMLMPTWSQEFNMFIDAIASKIIKTETNLDINDIRIQLKNEYRKYIAPSIIGCLGVQNGRAENLYSNLTVRFLKRIIGSRKVKNTFYGFLKRSSKKTDRVNLVEKSSPFFEESQNIVKFLTDRKKEIQNETFGRRLSFPGL